MTAAEPAGLSTAPGVADQAVERFGGLVDSRFTVDAEHLDDVVGLLHLARIHTLTVTPASLDALFLSTYGDDGAQWDAATGDFAGAGTPRRGPR